MTLRITFKRVGGRLMLHDETTGHGMLWYNKEDFMDFVKGDGGNKYEQAFREVVREIIAHFPEIKTGDFSRVNITGMDFAYTPATIATSWPQ